MPNCCRRRPRQGWIGLALAFGLADAAMHSCPAQVQPELPVIRVQLQWFHQAQFAGLYVADALGFYEREGIAVDFIQGGTMIDGGETINPLTVLSLGGADVAVAWLSNALTHRRNGGDVVNIAQVFRRPATALVCWRDVGIRSPTDLRGRTIGVWNVGDQYQVAEWLRHHGVSASEVSIVPQRAEARDLIERQFDCGTVMTFNEYWTLLRSGISPAKLYIVRFADEGSGLLEDGVYATGASLADPVKRERLVRFLRASAAGWRYAQVHPEEALNITLIQAPLAVAAHQRRMLDTVLSLVEPRRQFGLLDLDAFARSVHIVGSGAGHPEGTAAAARKSWTHEIWLTAGLDGGAQRDLTPAVRHYFTQDVDSFWFYALILVGTVTFALSGFMQAVRRRYDIWGAFVLAMLPAAAGGTLRDLLIAGDRHPPFIFKDPIYITLIFAVVAIGFCISRVLSERVLDSPAFTRAMILFDTIGFASFTVVGAQVALMAGLGWYWIPFCAGLTCAGGGMLLDIVTGREPRTFQGELYEEIAVAGGLLLYVLLLLANRYEHTPWVVTGAIVTTLVVVFTTRILVVRYGIRSYRLGTPEPSSTS